MYYKTRLREETQPWNFKEKDWVVLIFIKRELQVITLQILDIRDHNFTKLLEKSESFLKERRTTINIFKGK